MSLSCGNAGQFLLERDNFLQSCKAHLKPYVNVTSFKLRRSNLNKLVKTSISDRCYKKLFKYSNKK